MQFHCRHSCIVIIICTLHSIRSFFLSVFMLSEQAIFMINFWSGCTKLSESNSEPILSKIMFTILRLLCHIVEQQRKVVRLVVQINCPERLRIWMVLISGKQLTHDCQYSNRRIWCQLASIFIYIPLCICTEGRNHSSDVLLRKRNKKHFFPFRDSLADFFFLYFVIEYGLNVRSYRSWKYNIFTLLSFTLQFHRRRINLHQYV